MYCRHRNTSHLKILITVYKCTVEYLQCSTLYKGVEHLAHTFSILLKGQQTEDQK